MNQRIQLSPMIGVILARAFEIRNIDPLSREEIDELMKILKTDEAFKKAVSEMITVEEN